ncbi:hypothetical protein H0X10_04665, partial [Candidatus Saccharibacteria bacterium]|nr:hypothetical protein [Candidatus Saccharibacteria bacterium]
YKSIETDQKSASGEALDFSKVLGVWGKSEAGNETSGELYNETTLGVIPVGNLFAPDRKKLLELASSLDVYKVEYANINRTTINGRPAYEYTVKVLPSAYVTLLKAYAEAVGLTHLRNIDPANYENADSIEFKLLVDVRTRRLASIVYANGRMEKYVAYGTQATVDLPKETIPVEELQERIQQVQ